MNLIRLCTTLPNNIILGVFLIYLILKDAIQPSAILLGTLPLIVILQGDRHFPECHSGECRCTRITVLNLSVMKSDSNSSRRIDVIKLSGVNLPINVVS
jgi:hypothetical protein